MSLALGIDIGTSSLCALAFDPVEGRVVHCAAAPNTAGIAPSAPGGAEQDVSCIEESCRKLTAAVAGVVERVGDTLDVVGVTGQMHGILLVDAAGEAVSPLYTWRDGRAAFRLGPGSLAWARARDPQGASARCGCRVHAGYGGLTLAWLKSHGLLPEGVKALSIADYIAARLSGRIATDPTHAASWGLYDLAEGAWCGARCAALGVPGIFLPALRGPAEPPVPVLPAVALAWQLPATARVWSSVGDNQASVLGATQLRAGEAVLNLGTGGQISVPAAAVSTAPELETRPLPFGGFLRVGASLSGGAAYRTLCAFYRDVARALTGTAPTEGEGYACLEALLRTAPEGNGGVVADTRFSGTRGAPERCGALTGLREENLTAACVVGAVAEGMLDELLALGEPAGLAAASAVVATGNAVRRNPALQDLLARKLPMPVRLCPWEEEAAVGAALCAARALAETGETAR